MTSLRPTNYRDLIHRWHLKKKDPNAALSEPVEPIVWWVENTTPPEYRQTILDAGARWNEAFEKAGFKNAVVMKMMPDDADWDPADLRYNVIRFVSSDLGFAIGPSFVNPRTGQILGADITVDFGLIRGSVDEASLFSAFAPPGDQHLSKRLQHLRACSISRGLTADFAMGLTMAELSGEDRRTTLIKQFMTMLILHEMGHTMGLNHNMKASQLWKPAEIHNTAQTNQMGVMASVMDYDMVNIASDPSKQGDYYTSKTGPYDWWAIQYGYSVFPQGNEEAGLQKLLSRSTEKELQFGNDADIAGFGSGIDPRVQVWDMSGDMITYGGERFGIVSGMMAKLKDRYAKANSSYQELVNRYYALQWQRTASAQAISRYIGGIYVDRGFAGQPNAGQPYTPVPAEEQKRAMMTLSKYLFAPDAFQGDLALVPYLQRERRGFEFFGNPEDPKPERVAFSMQDGVLAYLTFPATLRRINSSTLYGNGYSAAEVLRDLADALFDADLKSGVHLIRQNIQTEYVRKMTAILNSNEHDAASKAAALNTLQLIRKKLRSASSPDEQTTAHRAALSFAIEKALSVNR
jgi:hypothetical protein